MDTMPMRSIKIALWVLSGVLVVSPQLHAQQRSSKAQKLEWPRTFTGQPDFAFTREEAMAEARTRAVRENEKLPPIPGLYDLMLDETRLDPLGLMQAAQISSSLVSGTEDLSGTVPQGPTLMDKLMANVVDLPSYSSATTQVDMSEFKSTLANTVRQTVGNWQPRAGAYRFGGLVNKLILQAIVTSPQQYAVINNQRYGIGDSFQLQVPVDVPDADIITALQSRLPAAGTFPQDIMQQYQQAYEDTIAAFANARTQKPSLGQQQVSLLVTVKDIQPRKVLIDLNGEPHELAIKFAY